MIPKELSPGGEQFAQHCKAYSIPFVREFRFHPARRWRFDFLIDPMIAVEIEGGTWSGGRHITGKGMTADIEKYNEATLMGFRLLRFTTGQVNSGYAIDTVRRALR